MNGTPFQEVASWSDRVERAVELGGDVSDVAVDGNDRIHLLCRHPGGVHVFSPAGEHLQSWGRAELTSRPHGITAGLDGRIHVVDEDDQSVKTFTSDGRLQSVVGGGEPSDTGCDWSLSDFHARVASIARGGPPFNHPTKVAVAPGGDLYVTDGYGNARVHRLSRTGALLGSWGEPGTGPGQFHVPHGLAITADERLLVADRENDRIQVFTPSGRHLESWTAVRRPSALACDPQGNVWVTEMATPAGHLSFVHGRAARPVPARLSVLDPRGQVMARVAFGGHPCDEGNVFAPHGAAIDSTGALYVAEITATSLKSGSGGLAPGAGRHCHVVHKFTI